MNLWSPDDYAVAWRFAAEAHRKQCVPGTKLPYIVHIGNVAMEVMSAIAARGDVEDANLAVQCAVLHDSVEDTAVTVDVLLDRFGPKVAAGVEALTKDEKLGNKDEKMRDSLARIQNQPQAVWMVKLADRITNLQPPPKTWNQEKIGPVLRGRSGEVGELEFMDGPHPGSNYLGVHARDDLSISLLQHRLNVLGTGIAVEVST
jgi:(p)ppGpp synthase/HD superfamily hydrolase